MKTVVLGGGIIGLTTAWSLHRRGVDVEVIEARTVGDSASAVNAGWITPSLSTPLASPGVLSTGLKHAFEKDGALRIRPQLDLGWLRWLWRFQRASRPREYRAGVRALFDLNRDTLDLFDELRDSGVDFEMHKAGMLALSLDGHGQRWFRRFRDELVPMGFPGSVRYLRGEEARELDPAVGERVTEAVHTTVDQYVQPDTLLAGLTAWLRDAGVTITENAPVRSLERRSADWLVRHAHGESAAGHVVAALGAATNTVLGTVGLRLPILGAKGYSVTLRGTGVPPAHAFYLLDAKLGISPFNDGVRIAGVFDMPSTDERVNERRVRALVNQAQPYLSGWTPGRPVDISTGRGGLRPATPDSLPFIGEVPELSGLYVATGHGMLGLTLAPVTAEAIADLIIGTTPRAPIDAFSLKGRIS
ncbi:NAD(P)/FAD-dependent oxidoreductase [Nonomuraea typhae]|uniref:NAD(P)/FAD-dependent oxidoreductase n=1 Tax=Nonomuraea typhae TaxID=2603600 RepID=A0ABW7YZG5_9ACTN